MKFYEKTIVARQDLSSNKLEDLRSKYKKIIDQTSGKVIKIEDWGLMNFARKIKRFNKGFYIHYKFQGGNETVKEIKKNIILDDKILNFLIVKMKELDTETEYFKKEK